MSDWLPHQQEIGKVFSIIALTLVPFNTLFRKAYSNFLDSVQLFYILAKVLSPNQSLFSTHLGFSWLQYMSDFLKYCNPGDFSCTYGHLLSPLLVWIGVCLVAMIVIKILKQKFKEVCFKSFYQFFKGFLRWTLGPLTYYSILVIISDIQNQINKNQFYPAIGTFVGLCLIILLEIIYYTCTQEKDEDPQPKWLNFMNHIRMGVLMSVLAVTTNVVEGPKYSLFLFILLYDFYFLIKYKFMKPVLERVLIIVSQLVLITMIALFIWKPKTIFDDNLDFLGLIIILLIQLFLLVLRIYYEINGPPIQKEDQEDYLRAIQNKDKIKKLHQKKHDHHSNNSETLKAPKKIGQKKGNLTSRVTSQKNTQKNSLQGSKVESIKSWEVGINSLQSVKYMGQINEELTPYCRSTRRKKDHK